MTGTTSERSHVETRKGCVTRRAWGHRLSPTLAFPVLHGAGPRGVAPTFICLRVPICSERLLDCCFVGPMPGNTVPGEPWSLLLPRRWDGSGPGG